MSRLYTKYTIRVGTLAHSRSGDEGNTANVGVLAYTEEGYEWLRRELTPEVVRDHFRSVCDGEVERFVRMPAEEVATIVRETTRFKFNCNLVVIDFLARHGLLDVDDPEYAQIVAGLRCPLNV